MTRVDRGRSTVATAHGELRPRTTDPVAVGDWVGVDTVADAIEVTLPRRSALSRRSPDKHTAALVVAANVDHVVLVHGLHLPVNLRRLERELVLAWDSGAVPVVVLTKCDLSSTSNHERERVEAVALGVDVLVVSGRTGEGLDELRRRLGAGRTFVMLGASGAGKSTLVNALVGA
ncbi:MAG TPA: GTPase RsgA, partial [Acidimicrobiales bacterium]